MICYNAHGEPVRMEIRVNRSFRLFWSPVVVVMPGWKPWKTPAAPPAADVPVNPFA
jgi:hypothetical protein